jgi:hypothetical protein
MGVSDGLERGEEARLERTDLLQGSANRLVGEHALAVESLDELRQFADDAVCSVVPPRIGFQLGLRRKEF